MRAVVFLAFFVTLAVSVQGGWWRRTQKSVKVEVGHGPKGPTIKGGLTIKFRKRRDAEEHGKYNVVLEADPCDFKSYDENQDGFIKFNEIKDIFDDTSLSAIFFEEADSNDDGSITKKEFEDFSEKKIDGCQE